MWACRKSSLRAMRTTVVFFTRLPILAGRQRVNSTLAKREGASLARWRRCRQEPWRHEFQVWLWAMAHAATLIILYLLSHWVWGRQTAG